MSAGWLLTVRNAQADVVELEQLDEAGLDWFAAGPGGEAIGPLAEVLPAAIGPGGHTEWIAAVIAAIERTPGTRRHLGGRAGRRLARGSPRRKRGGADNWMICPQPIAPSRLRLVEKDLARQR